MISLVHQRDFNRGRDSNRTVDLSFLTSYYSDQGKTKIREDLIDEKARYLGRGFAKGGIQANNDFGKRVSSSQLRNFFNEVRSLEAKIGSGEFEMYRPHIKMLKAKVAYARDRGKVSKAFDDLISKCVDLIEDKKDFEAFVLFFEAIVGYFYGEGGGKNQ